MSPGQTRARQKNEIALVTEQKRQRGDIAALKSTNQRLENEVAQLKQQVAGLITRFAVQNGSGPTQRN